MYARPALMMLIFGIIMARGRKRLVVFTGWLLIAINAGYCTYGFSILVWITGQ